MRGGQAAQLLFFVKEAVRHEDELIAFLDLQKAFSRVITHLFEGFFAAEAMLSNHLSQFWKIK